ncbi:MAG: hypothetical protein ACK41X_08405 [Pseudorhodoplanes sp.]
MRALALRLNVVPSENTMATDEPPEVCTTSPLRTVSPALSVTVTPLRTTVAEPDTASTRPMTG